MVVDQVGSKSRSPGYIIEKPFCWQARETIIMKIYWNVFLDLLRSYSKGWDQKVGHYAGGLIFYPDIMKICQNVWS